MNRKNIGLFLSIICLALMLSWLTSCSRVPPYSEELSALSQLLSEMDLVTKTRSLEFELHFYDEHTVHFVPDQNNPESGFIFFIRYNDSSKFYYLTADGKIYKGGDFNYRRYEGWEYPFIAKTLVDDENRGGYVLILDTDDQNPDFSLCYFNPNQDTVIYRIENKSIKEQIQEDFNTIFTGIDPAEIYVTGASLSPVDERLYLCCSVPAGADRRYYEFNYQADFTEGLADPQLTRTSGSLLISNHYYSCCYFYDVAQGLGIISDYQDTDFFYLSWDNTFTPEYVESLPEQFQYYLSNGSFLTDRTDYLSLYDNAGARLNVIVNCPLNFEYETIQEGTALSLFSYFTFYNSGEDRNTFTFYLYSLPTAALNEL